MGPWEQHTKGPCEDQKGSLCVWMEDGADGRVRWGLGLGAGITWSFGIPALF